MKISPYHNPSPLYSGGLTRQKNDLLFLSNKNSITIFNTKENKQISSISIPVPKEETENKINTFFLTKNNLIISYSDKFYYYNLNCFSFLFSIKFEEIIFAEYFEIFDFLIIQNNNKKIKLVKFFSGTQKIQQLDYSSITSPIGFIEQAFLTFEHGKEKMILVNGEKNHFEFYFAGKEGSITNYNQNIFEEKGSMKMDVLGERGEFQVYSGSNEIDIWCKNEKLKLKSFVRGEFNIENIKLIQKTNNILIVFISYVKSNSEIENDNLEKNNYFGYFLIHWEEKKFSFRKINFSLKLFSIYKSFIFNDNIVFIDSQNNFYSFELSFLTESTDLTDLEDKNGKSKYPLIWKRFNAGRLTLDNFTFTNNNNYLLFHNNEQTICLFDISEKTILDFLVIPSVINFFYYSISPKNKKESIFIFCENYIFKIKMKNSKFRKLQRSSFIPSMDITSITDLPPTQSTDQNSEYLQINQNKFQKKDLQKIFKNYNFFISKTKDFENEKNNFEKIKFLNVKNNLLSVRLLKTGFINILNNTEIISSLDFKKDIGCLSFDFIQVQNSPITIAQLAVTTAKKIIFINVQRDLTTEVTKASATFRKPLIECCYKSQNILLAFDTSYAIFKFKEGILVEASSFNINNNVGNNLNCLQNVCVLGELFFCSGTEGLLEIWKDCSKEEKRKEEMAREENKKKEIEMDNMENIDKLYKSILLGNKKIFFLTLEKNNFEIFGNDFVVGEKEIIFVVRRLLEKRDFSVFWKGLRLLGGMLRVFVGCGGVGGVEDGGKEMRGLLRELYGVVGGKRKVVEDNGIMISNVIGKYENG